MKNALRMAALAVLTSSIVMVAIPAVASSTPTQAASPRITSSAVPTIWSTVPSINQGDGSNDTSFNGISCVSSNYCIGVGLYDLPSTNVQQTLAELWNGSSWSRMDPKDISTSADNDLEDVSCVSTTFCEAVGLTYNFTSRVDQTLIEQWNGLAWSIVSSPNSSSSQYNSLNAVDCVSSQYCWAVGSYSIGADSRVITDWWDGGSWINIAGANPSSTANGLSGVSCPTVNFCSAVGEEGTFDVQGTLTENLVNNGSWETVSSPNGDPSGVNIFTSVSCTSASYCLTVGHSSTTQTSTFQLLTATWAGSKYTAVTSRNFNALDNNLLSVDCTSPSSCVATGYYFTNGAGDEAVLIETWNGASWSVASAPGNPASTTLIELSGISCVTATWCLTVGSYQNTDGDGFTLAVLGTVPGPPAGYRFVASDGGIFAFGNSAFYGSMGGQPLNKPIVAMANTADDKGYYLVASDGGIFNFGDALYHGSMGGQPLNAPIVGMTVTANGGYYLVASDGGIFSFGGAVFEGSMGGQHLNKPIVGIAVAANGGYYEVASDGGIFAFGGAPFHGSTGALTLNKPIVGIAVAANGGYYEVASDGGIFAFDAAFDGSMGGQPLNKPIVGIAVAANGGYYEVASDGGIFSFGGAPFLGSTGAITLNQPIVGMTALKAEILF